ncbi:CAP domain-containing protein [Pseudoduganella eburnea]|uniref:CAP domain-containing protein n=1 Tax=Massilia eburnea TaxID=1776165 RepID=A0A6L6QP48_9BURK|nr:CAP domain-containing protein [Massilia eburnea]MTW14139.1 CAP domain-containing protein [Massilia eburnea]
MKRLAILAIACASHILPARASDAEQLAAMVNAWRAAPATCQGRQRPAVPVLAPHRLLSQLALRPGTILLAALDQAGYDPEVADAVSVEGPGEARAAFDALRETYCATLGSTRYRDIGAHKAGNEWTIVLAAPAPNPVLLLPDAASAAQEVLDATNAARAVGRQCGDTWMAAAPPVAWNARLAAAALAHSEDMAQQSYFSHVDRRRQEAPQRVEAQGYSWRNVAENISRGQNSAQEAVNGWINSPGHCHNLMNPRFTEMGAGLAIHQARHPTAYWTQVFGTPR